MIFYRDVSEIGINYVGVYLRFSPCQLLRLLLALLLLLLPVPSIPRSTIFVVVVSSTSGAVAHGVALARALPAMAIVPAVAPAVSPAVTLGVALVVNVLVVVGMRC